MLNLIANFFKNMTLQIEKLKLLIKCKISKLKFIIWVMLPFNLNLLYKYEYQNN